MGLFETISKALLEYGVLGLTTLIFLVMWLRTLKECKQHVDKRITMAEKVIPILQAAQTSVNQFGEELHEGLEMVAAKQDEILVKLNSMEEGHGT